jgi:hypothetical protein
MVVITAISYNTDSFLLNFCNTVYIVFTSAAKYNWAICQV